MSFKSIVRELREMKDGIASTSKSGLDGRPAYCRARSLNAAPAPDEAQSDGGTAQQSRWANLPPELLLDVIRRIEASETTWPARRSVVGCASVCRLWRATTKEIVKTPEECGRITFPISLKQFTVYDSQPPCYSSVLSNSRSNRRIHSKQVSPRVPAGNYNIATVSYEFTVLRAKGPRRMQCTMHSIPVSAIQEGGTVPTLSGFPHSLEEQFSVSSVSKHKEPVMDFTPTSFSEPLSYGQTTTEPLVLKNKAPRWHEQLQCWCLNFKGRVTVASVKNFQLVAAVEPTNQLSLAEQEKVILQFGKIGKDIFTMDYHYPLSAFQAFAICLSSFDTKPACE
ncbi:hypothetical protein ACLOJK_001789 [Asimina triloba]